MKKEEQIRENLNRVLSEQADPSKTERVLNRLTGQGSIPERLSSLRERIEGLRVEAGDLSNLMEYHSGSRLSQVIDLLIRAEALTEETERLTTIPSEKYKILDRGESWEVWDYSLGLGLGFKKWDGQNRSPLLFIRTTEAYNRGEESFDDLISFARERFPQEFENLILPECL